MKNTATRYYRYYLTIFGIFAVIMFLLTLLLVLMGSNGLDWAAGAFFALVIPFIIYWGIRYRYFSRVELTNIQDVILERTYTRWGPTTLEFEIKMTIEGGERTVRTFAVFTSAWGFLGGPNKLDDYSGKTVKAGYDAKKGRAVVLDIL